MDDKNKPGENGDLNAKNSNNSYQLCRPPFLGYPPIIPNNFSFFPQSPVQMPLFPFLQSSAGPPPDPAMYQKMWNMMAQQAAVEKANTTIQIGINPQFNNQANIQNVDLQKQAQSVSQDSQKRTPAKKILKRPSTGVAKQLKMPIGDPGPRNLSFGLEEDHGFDELKRVAKNGCEIAEKLVEHHRKRPCFRKIDVLCSRLMQDLDKDNYKNVIANINSQGIAWAVKDFIFTFTRIINAWIIMRGYVYNKLDGLERVKEAVDPDMGKNFLAWQETTAKLVDSLVKSYVNLDHTVQNQRGGSTPKSSKDQCNESIDLDKSCQNLSQVFDTIAIEESEEAQRKYNETGTYFKSAVYHPLKKETPTKDKENDLLRLFNDDLDTSEYYFGAENETIPECASFITSTPKKQDNFKKKLHAIEEYDLFGFKKEKKLENMYEGSGDGYIINIDQIKQETWIKMFRADADKIKSLFKEILALKEVECFYCPSIGRMYYPQTVNVIPENEGKSINLSTIIFKIQCGAYTHQNELFSDLRNMVVNTKVALQDFDQSKFKIISQFEVKLEKILAQYFYLQKSSF